MHHNLLQRFDEFAQTLRLTSRYQSKSTSPHISTPHNLSVGQRKAIAKFQHNRNTITIKPADKNLGIVIMDTDDYITQCTTLLMDYNTYRSAHHYPHTEIRRSLEEIIAAFKEEIKHLNKHLYNYLLPTRRNNQTPKFYGIPKIHKKFNQLPPMSPIVAQSSSPLAPSAHFLDHVLQPLAQSYGDYIQNSTSLILKLQALHVPEATVLVTVEVVSLYPSIPQTECLKIAYAEMQKRRNLISADPNLIIRLLHLNINFNYFLFADLYFQQIQGTAMGAAFSPTIANIFMSVTLQNFLKTQPNQPVLLVRYIDDIFMIWPDMNTLDQFLSNLNAFHPNLKFTHTSSNSTIDFLDLTIYKGPNFSTTHKLDMKTFQKEQNLYQYLEYTSAHPCNTYNSIVLGECVRYLRSNTRLETYLAVVKSFQKRLQERQYPNKLTGKLIARIKFSERLHYLQKSNKHNNATPIPPIFKCHPPPRFSHL